MSTPVFPIPRPTNPWGWMGVVWDVVKTPSFDTKTQRTVTQREAALSYAALPVWTFELAWSRLRDDMSVPRNAAKNYPALEFELLTSFFLARRGGFEAFFFNDPTDRQVTRQIISGSTPVGVTDYPLVRSWGVGGFVEPVGGVNESDPIVIRVDGAPVGFTPNVPGDGWVRLDNAPPPGAVIDGDYSYFFKVRFPDKLDLNTFGFNFWQLKKVTLHSVIETVTPA